MDKRPLKVFLCHASTDKPKVRELYRYLKRRGINPWFDEEHLVGGQDWQVEIPKALATSDAIIICLTKNSADKEGYIQKEIKFALDKALEMPEGRIFLIPVKFEECEVPFTLSRYQWVDLTVESGYAKMMKALKFRASQLERSTVEISKKDVEEENLVRAKMEKETAEKAHLKAEEEERRKSAREEEEQESAQKIAREKLQREIDKRTKDFERKYKREIFFSRIRNKISLFFLYFRYYIFPAILLIGIAIGVLYVWNPFLERNLFPTPTSQIATESIALSSTPAITFTLTATPLPTEITDAKGVPMALVPAGEFVMGSWNGDDDENPPHAVYLYTFYIDKYEVTNVLYQTCVEANVCSLLRGNKSTTRVSYYGNSDFDNYPVIDVTLYQAQDYCEWRGARLPTEAEWEKAARGTDGRTYPWGEGINCSNANYNNYCMGDTTPVGSYESGKSPYGIYDMAGNVWEWVYDWYSPTYYEISPYLNPIGPDSQSSYRGLNIARGGAWNEGKDIVRVSNRYRLSAGSNWYGNIGFRCIYTEDEFSEIGGPSLVGLTTTPSVLSTPTEVFSTSCVFTYYPNEEIRCSCNSVDCFCYRDLDMSNGFQAEIRNYFEISRYDAESRAKTYGGICQ